MPKTSYANVGLLMRGIAKTLMAPFEIPKAMLVDSGKVLFPFGIVSGTVRGSMRTIAGTLGGAVDLVRGAAPYAKYMVFFI